MAVRDFSWIDIPFGLFLAMIIVGASATVAAIILIFILGFTTSEVFEALMVVAAAALAVSILVLVRTYPGPGPMIERPLRALAAFMALPMLTVVLIVLGVIPWAVWVLAYAFFPSLVIGFAVLFAIYSEVGRYSQPKRSWPIVRPAGSQGGVHGILPQEAKVVAGLERGGAEEERPDTFLRMKTRE